MKEQIFRNGLIFGIFFMFIGAGVIPAIGNSMFEEHSTLYFEIYVPDGSTIEFLVTLPTPNFDTVSVAGENFATVTLPGTGYNTILGDAQLPVSRQMVEIPQGSTPEITITSLTWEYISLNEIELPSRIYPVQPSIYKIPNASNEFCINDEYYETNDFLPADIVKVVDLGEIRGRRFALIECSTVQYNPYLGELKILKSCEIRIDLPGSDMVKTAENYERYKSPSFENLLKKALVNYGSYEEDTSNNPRGSEGYLIIVYDNFEDEIQPLATWKQSKGFDVTVTKTSQIPGGPTKENIKNYIVDAYNNWPTPPAYILLVGDTGQIPTYYGTTGPSAVDLYYVTINPDDYFPDIHIGRFPAASENDVTAMVDKTVYYEQGQFPSNEWIKKAVFMASTDQYWVSEGTHNYVIDTYLIPNGYTCDKLYTYTYGATTQDVHDSLNDGRSLAIFSGHGSPSGWGDGPPFYQSDIQALTNENMYPFVCSHSCLTGTFDNSECFGETWLRVENKGGLAFWGASASTYWNEDDTLEKAMFQAWWSDGLETIGGMTDMALYYLYQNYSGGGATKYYFEAYNILGDPSVKIWSDDPNSSPDKPSAPNGPTEGVTEVEYSFTTHTTDPEGEQIWYMFEWGDGEYSDWIGPYNSGGTGEGTHSWTEEGDYEIRAKAKDINGGESEWSDPLSITILKAPVLQIQPIKGGLFRVNTVIRNEGAVNAVGVEWEITLEGGTIFLGRTTTGKILEIIPGEGIEIQSNLIIGLGEITVKVTAEVPESSCIRHQGGRVFIFYVYINPGGGL